MQAEVFHDHAGAARAFAAKHPVTIDEKVVRCSFGCSESAVARVIVSGGNLIFQPGAVVDVCYEHLTRTSSVEDVLTLIIYRLYEFGEYIWWHERRNPPALSEVPETLIEQILEIMRK